MGKKGQISWDFQGQIRRKNINFAGIFKASFTEKQLVMNSFLSKFHLKAIGLALI